MLNWWPAIAWMVFIFIMSAMPKPPDIPCVENLIDKLAPNNPDKLKHFAGYAVLGILVWRSLGSGISKWRRLLLAVIISGAYGATDEFHQRFVQGRSCDVFDWIADVTGALLGATALSILRRGGVWTWQKRTVRKKVTK